MQFGKKIDETKNILEENVIYRNKTILDQEWLELVNDDKMELGRNDKSETWNDLKRRGEVIILLRNDLDEASNCGSGDLIQTQEDLE